MIGSSIFSMSRGIGPARRVIDLDHRPIREVNFVADAGRRGDEVEVELALQPLLDDLHVQQAEKAAPESEAERDRAFRLEEEGGVVELEFFQSIAQQGVLVRIDGIDAGEDHRLDLFKAGQGVGGGARVLGDGVADARVGDVLDGGDEEADFAGGELLDLDGLGGEHAHRLDVEDLVVPHEANLHALAHAAVNDAREHDHAAVRVEPRVENERLERCFRIALGRRQAGDDGFENVGNALAGFGGDRNGAGRVEADGLLDHLLGAHDVGAGEVDFVDDGNDFEAVIDGEVGVGEGLGFDALGGIDNQERTFARGQRARDFVARSRRGRACRSG